ncbi:MAG TPA: LPS assembly lipoprotein LptE [Gammaproteobacteria bacterium]|nr:LPS assembly lipoprotein LptE [Gammaproteobacteria bacterium]
MRVPNPGLAACVLLLGALTACGFQLRQPPNLPPQMRAIYISSGNGSIALIRNLRRDLTAGNSQVVDDPGQATAYLKIVSVSQNSSLLAISNTGVPLEYKAYYQVEFSLQAGNNMVVEPQTLVLTRTYNYNISDAIGNQEQAQGLFNAMATDMAQLITFRIQAAAKAAMPVPSATAAPAKATLQAPPAATRPSGH